MGEDGERCFGGQALTPEAGMQVVSEFPGVLPGRVGTKAGTADMLMTLEEKNWPILNAALLAHPDFVRQPGAHHLWGKRPAEEAGHFGIAP